MVARTIMNRWIKTDFSSALFWWIRHQCGVYCARKICGVYC